jgi:hypothetical protein
MPISTKAITSLIKLTVSEPTLFPAASKAIGVAVQHTAVAKAAISPI